MKQCGCGSFAINDHPESDLCDKCWWRVQSEIFKRALLAIQEAPGGGPARRIVAQALNQKPIKEKANVKKD